ncbi:hypothetical protein Lalb_Chr06g0171451 [Lupinus albus]|uniref:Uncharacterized protein n=1 Tax=Lupinus albus TaxID=3870 RepID=A0A6A4QF96_LUPAL|nr:hypothetical protein Lalb_Chr06g0171451 [Lupinus albus]
MKNLMMKIEEELTEKQKMNGTRAKEEDDEPCIHEPEKYYAIKRAHNEGEGRGFYVSDE